MKRKRNSELADGLVSKLEHSSGYEAVNLTVPLHDLRCRTLANSTRLFLRLSRSSGLADCMRLLRQQLKEYE